MMTEYIAMTALLEYLNLFTDRAQALLLQVHVCRTIALQISHLVMFALKFHCTQLNSAHSAKTD